MSLRQARVIREAQGAGRWFPAGKKELEDMVDGYIAGANVPVITGRIVAAIAPHAGFQYSGRTAGYTFRAFKNQAETGLKPETVVVVGFVHRMGFEGVALMDGDAIKTPMGETDLDKEAVAIMTNDGGRVFVDYGPHRSEHSAENEIPFVQRALPDAKVVVALMGDHDIKTVENLVAALEKLGKRKKIVVVASTDLLHDADYDLVTKTDKATLKRMEEMDIDGLARSWSGERQVCCGIAPVLGVMKYAKGQGCKQGTVLFYRNNGDDDRASHGVWVVGYGAAVFAVKK